MKEQKISQLRLYLMIVVLLAATLTPHFLLARNNCADSLLNSPRVTQILLDNRWDQFLEVFKQAPYCSLNANAVLLQAHAALATGKNNMATALFILIQDSTQLARWHTWAKRFSESHPNAPVGHYFLGDAKARLSDFDGAINEFNTALTKAPSFYLARNARGVVNAIIYQAANAPVKYRSYIEAAISDFAEVNRAHPKFVDALVNRAVAHIEANQLRGAQMYFNQAIQADSKHALAYNGRAILYLNERKNEAAQKDIVQADSLLPDFPYVLWNAKALTNSSDTTSTIGRIAWVKGKDTNIDSVRGFSQFDWDKFQTSSFQAIGGAAEMFTKISGVSDLLQGIGGMASTITESFKYGGIYLDVQIATGTQHVGTNFVLAYPRSKKLMQ